MTICPSPERSTPRDMALTVQGAGQRSPSPPITESNHSISVPTTPPDSSIPTPHSEIAFGSLGMMDQWPIDPHLGDNQSDPEDGDAGYHSDNFLEEMT